MNLLPRATSEFGKTDYWNSFFQKRGKKAFEWYGEYPELCGILHKYIRTKDKILVIGCGNSTLSSDLYNVGYKQIMNIDVSGVVIKQMKARNKGKEGLEYQRMDATDTTFQDGQFNVVLDKGTLDALMPDSSPDTLQRIDKLIDEIDRVLSMLGRYVCVSLLQQHILKHLIDRFSGRGWMVRVCRCEEAENNNSRDTSGITLPVFVVICTKLKPMPESKPVLEICHTADVVQRMSGAGEMMASVKSIQDTALMYSGLNRCNIAGTGEVTVEISRPDDLVPKYTVTVVDSPKAKDPASMKFAAFVVPLGREREWLFGTAEGRQELLVNSQFDRLAIIRLHREHKYEDLKTIQAETADAVTKLAPQHKGPGPRPKIPFLSVAQDLGTEVTEVARGESQISGGYVIEDVKLEDDRVFRRLVFLLTQNVVQSEAKLKKVVESGSTRHAVDVNHLACEHHVYMTMGVGMVAAAADQTSDVLVIGLGGGALCTYIRNCYKHVRITAIDIDPEILEIATKYFDLQQDDQLQVVIEDGLDYLKTACAKAGTKFSAVLFDVDSKDPSLGLSCPPETFLEPEILAAVANCLTESGVFILNFVCRVQEIRQRTLSKLSELFKDISSIKLKQEVNEIFFCWKTKEIMSLDNAADRINTLVQNEKIAEDDVIHKEELKHMIRTF